MVEIEEELKNILMMVKRESEKAGLKSTFKKLISREQDGRGEGGSGVQLSPRIRQEYTFSRRSTPGTSAEGGQEYLSSRKKYIDPHKTR